MDKWPSPERARTWAIVLLFLWLCGLFLSLYSEGAFGAEFQDVESREYQEPPPAERISFGVLAFAHHPFSDEISCIDGAYEKDQVRVDWNEEPEGIYVMYNGWLLGTYRNSYADCPGATQRTTLFGYEAQIGTWRGIQFSTTAALADGYPEYKGYDGYMPWASLNAQYGYAKMWYAYKVVAIGFQYDF